MTFWSNFCRRLLAIIQKKKTFTIAMILNFLNYVLQEKQTFLKQFSLLGLIFLEHSFINNARISGPFRAPALILASHLLQTYKQIFHWNIWMFLYSIAYGEESLIIITEIKKVRQILVLCSNLTGSLHFPQLALIFVSAMGV